jgi:hypothetical protein
VALLATFVSVGAHARSLVRGDADVVPTDKGLSVLPVLAKVRQGVDG